MALTFQPFYPATIDGRLGLFSRAVPRREDRQAESSPPSSEERSLRTPSPDLYWSSYLYYKAPGGSLAAIGSERQYSPLQPTIWTNAPDEYYLPHSGHALPQFGRALSSIPQENEEEINNLALTDLTDSARQITDFILDDEEDWRFRPEQLDEDAAKKPYIIHVGNAEVVAGGPGWMKQYADAHQAKWLAENNDGIRPPPKAAETPLDYDAIKRLVECGFEGTPDPRDDGGYGSEGEEDDYYYFPQPYAEEFGDDE